jgi:hypothetical protein
MILKHPFNNHGIRPDLHFNLVSGFYPDLSQAGNRLGNRPARRPETGREGAAFQGAEK